MLVNLIFLITPGNLDLEWFSRVVLPTQLVFQSVTFLFLALFFSLHFQLRFHKIGEMVSQHTLYRDAKVNHQEISQLLLTNGCFCKQLMLEFLARTSLQRGAQ